MVMIPTVFSNIKTLGLVLSQPRFLHTARLSVNDKMSFNLLTMQCNVFQEMESKNCSSIVDEKLRQRQGSYHNIFDSDEEEFHKDFFSDFSRPKSVGTIPKSKRKLSTNISDPCLLSCLPSDISNMNRTTDRSTNNSELNSLDSGIPEEINGTTKLEFGHEQASKYKHSPDAGKNEHFHRVFVERKTDFSDLKGDLHRSRGNSLGHYSARQHDKSPTNVESNNELLNSKLNKTVKELSSLKISHGKLQKVLSEKASELSSAVRKAEVYEREAKKLRHKLEEIRRQQRHERQNHQEKSASDNKMSGTGGKIVLEKRKNVAAAMAEGSVGPSNNLATANIVKHESSNEEQQHNDGVYDEIEAQNNEDSPIYDSPKPVLAVQSFSLSKVQCAIPDKSELSVDENFVSLPLHNNNEDNELHNNPIENNKLYHEEDINNGDADDESNQAIYATVNLELKKSAKQRQKSCANGSSIFCDKENIVALI